MTLNYIVLHFIHVSLTLMIDFPLHCHYLIMKDCDDDLNMLMCKFLCLIGAMFLYELGIVRLVWFDFNIGYSM